MLMSQFPQQSHRFEHVFGCEFKALTFGDQKRQWKRATEEQHQAVLDGGHTPLGLWSIVVNRVPLKQ